MVHLKPNITPYTVAQSQHIVLYIVLATIHPCQHPLHQTDRGKIIIVNEKKIYSRTWAAMCLLEAVCIILGGLLLQKISV
jgi:hypothetical protein